LTNAANESGGIPAHTIAAVVASAMIVAAATVTRLTSLPVRFNTPSRLLLTLLTMLAG
jgi:hypothetical protein